MASAARCSVLAALCAVGLGAAAPVRAEAAGARVCSAEVALRDSPGGFVIGYLLRRDRVRLVRSASRHWAHVDTPLEVRGWIPRRSLCGR